MIDLKERMNESVKQVHFYGCWLTYGGLVVILASIIGFIYEFMQMVSIARKAEVYSGK